MYFDLILKNGEVVDPRNNVYQGLDVGIKDGKIAEVKSDLENGEEIIDVSDQIIMPGIIDMHTHVTQYIGGNVGYKMIAETGVTTTIDFAGSIRDITSDLNVWGCGLNVGSIEAIIPGRRQINSSDPSYSEIKDFLGYALEDGSLGLKLFGGHAPLTPNATEMGIKIANELEVMVAFHAGTTETRSDITGMREAIDLAKGKRLLLAHINAYCRGRVSHSLDELKEALSLLRENKNVFADSHLAIMNGTNGNCKEGFPQDYVTRVCLELYDFPVTEKGLEQAILHGVVHVVKKEKTENRLLEGEKALNYWRKMDTRAQVSFPANLPTIAVACAVEKEESGNFVIDMASTDGGGIPRNNLIKRMLSLFHMGYLSLEDVVSKVSLNPARIFGLINKGHLSIGADADITVLDITKSEAVMSFVKGNLNMKNGNVLGNGGRLLTTEFGIRAAKNANLCYEIVDFDKSDFYKK